MDLDVIIDDVNGVATTKICGAITGGVGGSVSGACSRVVIGGVCHYDPIIAKLNKLFEVLASIVGIYDEFEGEHEQDSKCDEHVYAQAVNGVNKNHRISEGENKKSIEKSKEEDIERLYKKIEEQEFELEFERIFNILEEVSVKCGKSMINTTTAGTIAYWPPEISYYPIFVDFRSDVWSLGMKILKGLRFCNPYNLMHRDLKPDKLLSNKNEEVNLCDFGKSRFWGSKSGKRDEESFKNFKTKNQQCSTIFLFSYLSLINILVLSSPVFNLFLASYLIQSNGLATAIPIPLKASNSNDPRCEFWDDNKECLTCERFYMKMENSDSKICLDKCHPFQYGTFVGHRIECRGCSDACSEGCRGPNLNVSKNGCNRCKYGAEIDGQKTCVQVKPESNSVCKTGHFPEKANAEESNWTDYMCRKCHPECTSCESFGQHPVTHKCVCKNYQVIDYRNEVERKICSNECPSDFIKLPSLNHTSDDLCIRCKEDETIDPVTKLCTSGDHFVFWILLDLTLLLIIAFIIGICLGFFKQNRFTNCFYTSRYQNKPNYDKNISLENAGSTNPLITNKENDKSNQ